MDLPTQLALLLGYCTNMPDLVGVLHGTHTHCMVQSPYLLDAELPCGLGHGVMVPLMVPLAWGVP